MTSRAQLYNWFLRLMKPTAGQFKEVFDSYFHKDEDELAIGKVTNLGATLALKADKSEINALNNQTVIIPAGTATYNVPAGTLIEKFLIIAPTNINFSVGTTNGGQEIIETYQVVSSSVYAKDVYFEVATTIYFGGVAGDTIIKIFKR